MAKMILHFLNARNPFSGLEGWLAEVLTVGFDRVATLLPLRDTDVVVKVSENVIPETGHHGYAPEAGLIHITIDPNHKYFRKMPTARLKGRWRTSCITAPAGMAQDMEIRLEMHWLRKG